RKSRAAAFASRSGRPVIDDELSSASINASAEPSWRAFANAAGRPFSVNSGCTPAATRAVTRTSGNDPKSTWRISTGEPADAPAGSASGAAAASVVARRLMLLPATRSERAPRRSPSASAETPAGGASTRVHRAAAPPGSGRFRRPGDEQVLERDHVALHPGDL